jgi:hypothetical protein
MQVLVPQLKSIFARWILVMHLWIRVHNNPVHVNVQLVVFKEETNFFQHARIIYMHDIDGPSRSNISLLAKITTNFMNYPCVNSIEESRRAAQRRAESRDYMVCMLEQN